MVEAKKISLGAVPYWGLGTMVAGPTNPLSIFMGIMGGLGAKAFLDNHQLAKIMIRAKKIHSRRPTTDFDKFVRKGLRRLPGYNIHLAGERPFKEFRIARTGFWDLKPTLLEVRNKLFRPKKTV